MYNPPSGSYTNETSQTIAKLGVALELPGHHLATGDFNLHHRSWGGARDINEHTAAGELLNLATERQLQQILPPGSITWQARNSVQTLDLAWASPGIATRVITCQVQMESEHGSDYYPVETVLNMSIPEKANPPRKLWKKADAELINAAVNRNLPPAGEIRNQEDLEDAVDQLTKTIQSAIQAHVPMARPSKWAKAFWARGCSELVEKAREARKKFNQSGSQEDWLAMRVAINKKGHEVKRSKQEQFRRDLAEAAEKHDVWRIARKMKETVASGPTQIPPLKKEDGTWAETNEEKAGRLKARFFPPTPEADLDDIEGFNYPEKYSCNLTVTEEEVK